MRIVAVCAGVVAAGCAWLSAAMESPSVPPYGAEDFVPTPEQPIGFQADGNGWYPGAAPAVVEWWNGKPGWGKVVSRGGEGNQSPPFDDSSYKEMELRVFTDSAPKNILWKVPTPGHSDAQPVVVGDRIICTFYPHFTVCYDKATGEELWRDAMEMAFLPVMGQDRKTLGPVPDPAEASKMQTLLGIATAMSHLAQNLRDFEGEDPGPAEYPLVQKAIERMGEWRKILEEVHSLSVPLLDEDIALAKRFLAGEHTILGMGQKKSLENREYHKKTPQFGDPWCFRKNLVNSTAKLLNAPIVGSWPGWMPYHVASPCSDGEIVVVRFCHGQLGALEVATGKRLWAWRDTEAQLGWTWHANSPRIKDDLVFLDSIGKRTNRHAADGGPGMFGIDKRTGAVRWFSPGPAKPAGNYPICTLIFVDVPDATEKVRPVLVNWEGVIIEQATGKRSGDLPGKCQIHESHPLAIGDRILSPHGVSGGRTATLDLRLRGDGRGGVAYTTNSVVPFASYRGAWVRNDQVIMPCGYDFRTGNSAGGLGIGGEHTGPSIIGPIFVDVLNKFDGSGCDYKYRPRRDGVTLGSCVVAEAEVRPYDAPRVLSDRNLLGGAEAPSDLFFDTYLAGFDKMRQINPKKHCGRYGNIITAYFGHCMNGPVASGERIFIQSQCYLYCIGPAVKGTPTDDPTVVAAIRAAKSLGEVTRFLESDSAQYRYEAVRRIADLRLPISDLEKKDSASQSAIGNRQSAISILKSLATEDAYEEIRAEAVLALDASDPAGRAGWDRLLADYAVNFWSDPPPKEGWAYHTNRDRTERRHGINLTLRSLGESGRAMMEKHWEELAAKPLSLKMALDIATWQRWRIEGLVKAGLEVMQGGPLARTPPWRTQVPVNTENPRCLPGYFAAIDAASDPATAQILMEKLKKSWELYPTFARNLKPDQLLAWIEPIALASSHPSNHPRILNAWKAVGKAALPSMQRVKATVEARTPEQDRLAADYAKAIGGLIEEME